MKGAIADNINNRTNKQSNKLSSPAKKTSNYSQMQRTDMGIAKSGDNDSSIKLREEQ